MDNPERAEYLPTLWEIAQACEAIRAGWTLSERRRRAGGRLIDESTQSWLPPMVDTSPLRSRFARGLADLAV
jgi:hypothetical protein